MIEHVGDRPSTTELVIQVADSEGGQVPLQLTHLAQFKYDQGPWAQVQAGSGAYFGLLSLLMYLYPLWWDGVGDIGKVPQSVVGATGRGVIEIDA